MCGIVSVLVWISELSNDGFFKDVMQFGFCARSRLRRYSDNAFIKVPHRRLTRFSQPMPKFLSVSNMAIQVARVHSVRWVHWFSIFVLKLTSLHFSLQELLHRDYFYSRVFFLNRLKMKKVSKGKPILLFRIFPSHQINALFRWKDKCSAHGMSQRHNCFKAHSDIVPTPFIWFKSNIFFLWSIASKWADKLCVGRDVPPVDHFLGNFRTGPTKSIAIQASNFVVIRRMLVWGICLFWSCVQEFCSVLKA
mmetsp:Transcript_5997/g.14192  ORF Transcript_5997/g.14192 Transcript_5997/m.14192 type:complete len:250 (-) Transcript_5997:186-935(-)